MKKYLYFGLLITFSLTACDRTSAPLHKFQLCLHDFWQEILSNGADSPVNPIIARFDNEDIRASDLQRRFDRSTPSEQAHFATPQGKRDALDQEIRFLLMIRLAERAGLDRDPAFRENLENFRKTRLALLAGTKLVAREVAVSSSDTLHYYQAHFQDYSNKVVQQASQIVLGNMAQAQYAQQLLHNKIPFEEVARLMSLNKLTRPNGGKMPPFILGTQDPAMERALQTLRPGQISGILSTKIGFQIVRKDAPPVTRNLTFAEVQKDIENHLRQIKLDQWQAKTLESHHVKINEDAYNAFQWTPLPSLSTIANSEH